MSNEHELTQAEVLATILANQAMQETEGPNLGPVNQEHNGHGRQGDNVPETDPDAYLLRSE